MPFVEIEDVGTTPRRKLTPHRRLKVWEGAAGVCVLCDRKIDGVRERWIVEHIRALELGGADDLSPKGRADETCARGLTNPILVELLEDRPLAQHSLNSTEQAIG